MFIFCKNISLLRNIVTQKVMIVIYFILCCMQLYNLQSLTTIRGVSYRGSQFVEDLGEVNVKYNVTKDPIDWKYVERTLPPLIVPEPTKKDFYPSGWKPQTEDVRDKPYFIERTKNHMLPVYLKLAQRGIKRHTYVRKVQGDIFLLDKELREFLQKESFQPVRSQAHEFAGYIRIKGDFVNACKYWLEKKGY